MWTRKSNYWVLTGESLLEYAHRRGVWLTDSDFSPADNRDLAEHLIAEKIGDGEIRRRIREREHEIRDNRMALAAMWSAVASLFSALCALAALFLRNP
jgi:hypothetical protein